jgi:hypothetical protein
MKRQFACLLALMLVSMNGRAEPYAPKAETNPGMTSYSQQVVGAAKVPEKEVVGLPAYPGAVVISTHSGGELAGHRLLPYIQLLSKAPPEKVLEWYRKKISSWTCEKLGDAETACAENPRKLMETPSVVVEGIESDETLHSDFPDARTIIWVRYQPK